MNIIIVVEYNYSRLKLNKYISYVFIVEYEYNYCC
jgi:hypothetical protein